ncbi:hypothetical protein HDE_00359 [Halotydeus destructor]|nr:hypothetical protein HDE_00359 [Halotydeus destructor]
MDDDIFDDETECDLALSSKEYERENELIEKAAFRDGMLEAKDKSMQQGFEDGLNQAYTNYSVLSKLKAYANVIHSSVSNHEDASLLQDASKAIVSVEKSLEKLETLDSLDILHDEMEEAKKLMTQLCDKLDLGVISSLIAECCFTFDKVSHERLKKQDEQ